MCNQKNPGLSFDSIQNVFSFLPLGEAFISSFVFEADIAVCTLWGDGGEGVSNSAPRCPPVNYNRHIVLYKVRWIMC